MFVAHPHCQQLLTSLWYDRLPGWRRRQSITKVIICLGLVSLLPILTPVYLIFPRGRVGRMLKSPLVKFLNHSASFAIFLLLLLVASTDLVNVGETQKNRHRVRGPDPNWIELLILWWVLGFVWSEMKQIWEEGFKAYVRQWWNWLDLLMLGLYLSSLAMRAVAMAKRKLGGYGSVELPRSQWPDDDPTLVSEALFSIAHIFSFARIIFLFQINEHLGPLQISLGNMLIDIAKFIFIFLLVITSFACGLNQLYYFYTVDENITKTPFNTLISSYQTLFWQLFGVTHLDHIKLSSVVYNTSTENIKSRPLSSAKNTVLVAEILLLIYHSMAIIVLVNMLIAMMSNSFQTIQNHADTEWKFARSKLWVTYFDEGCTLPPPLNTIPSPKWIIRALVAFFQCICRFFCCCSKPARFRFQSRLSGDRDTLARNVVEESIGGSVRMTEKRETTESGNRKGMQIIDVSSNCLPFPNGGANSAPGLETNSETYQTIIKKLVTRFIHHTKKNMRQDGVNEDDLLEIKQDISSLRFELREDRQKEVLRATGHLDNLKYDLIRTISQDKSNSFNSTKSSATSPFHSTAGDRSHTLTGGSREKYSSSDVSNNSTPTNNNRHSDTLSSPLNVGSMPTSLPPPMYRRPKSQTAPSADAAATQDNVAQSDLVAQIKAEFVITLKAELRKEMQEATRQLVKAVAEATSEISQAQLSLSLQQQTQRGLNTTRSSDGIFCSVTGSISSSNLAESHRPNMPLLQSLPRGRTSSADTRSRFRNQRSLGAYSSTATRDVTEF